MEDSGHNNKERRKDGRTGDVDGRIRQKERIDTNEPKEKKKKVLVSVF